MENDRTHWGVAEWKAHALTLEAAHQSALDGWGATVAELENHASELQRQRELNLTLSKNRGEELSAFIAMLDFVQGEVSGGSGKRKRGRPSKQEQSVMLLALVESQRAAFIAANPATRISDPAVLSWHFQNEYRKLGLRPQRVNSVKFKEKLKTMCNKISDARAEAKKQSRRELPENS